MEYKLIITNGSVVDGTGAPAFQADVAVRNDGKLALLPPDYGTAAARVVNAAGKCVAPGFIDGHSHGDIPLGKPFNSLSKLSQGVTTHVAGQCGFSMFPVVPSRLQAMQSNMSILTEDFPACMESFHDFNSYLQYAQNLSFPESVAFLVGHVSLRIAAMGFDDRTPTAQELAHMETMLAQALEQGCFGLSLGLIYVPSAYAQLDELSALCKVVAAYDAVCTVHIRNESVHLLDAIGEVIELGRRTGCRMHISHLKVCGKANWGKAAQALSLIDRANAEGIRITADQYPYTASMTTLGACIHPSHFTRGNAGLLAELATEEGRARIKAEILADDGSMENRWLDAGGADGVLIAIAQHTPEYEGRSIGESARALGMDPMDILFDALVRNECSVSAIYFAMNEADVNEIIKREYVIVGSDGIVKLANERAHPRAYGTFTRALRVFAREQGILSLEETVRRMTSLVTQIYHLPGKGLLRDGFDGDIVLFDPHTIADTADYQISNSLSTGIESVFIAGDCAYANGQILFAQQGRCIKRDRHVPFVYPNV